MQLFVPELAILLFEHRTEVGIETGADDNISHGMAPVTNGVASRWHAAVPHSLIARL